MYFNDCTTQDELKKRFRELCKKLHPDNGGSAAEFIAMKKEFDALEHDARWYTFKTRSGETYTKNRADVKESPAMFARAVETLVNLDGVIVELCGVWLWVTGNTKPHKETIKQLGGKWSKNKAAWYIHYEPFKKRSKKSVSLDRIRAMYGSKVFERGADREPLPEA